MDDLTGPAPALERSFDSATLSCVDLEAIPGPTPAAGATGYAFQPHPVALARARQHPRDVVPGRVQRASSRGEGGSS